MVCSVSGCERPQHARGYCQIHYRRQLEGRDINAPIRPTRRSEAENQQLLKLAGTVVGSKVCIVPGCQNIHEAHGFCHKHYLAWRAAGGVKPVRKYERGRVCSVNGCGARHEANGYCKKHYMQYRRGTLTKDPKIAEILEKKRKLELYEWQLKINKMFA